MTDIVLTDGDDVYSGTEGDDEIIALDGDDIINGGGGNDTIIGGWGNNTLFGDGGDDTIYGFAAKDVIHGGDGDDIIWAYAGQDIVFGGAGSDRIELADSDNLYEDFGNWGYGGEGDDYITGGTGNDTISGDAGNDTLYAKAGDDILNGGSGSDLIYAEEGNDLIDGGGGADKMYGGEGNDTYVYDNVGDRIIESLNSDDIDTVQSFYGFSLSNTTIFQGNIENAQLRGTNNVNLGGNVLNNTLTGNAGSNIINGGAGNDVINGFTGNDTLTGGAGSDRFLFNTSLNASTNVDKITDFNVPQDAIWLDNAVFKALGNPALLSAAQFHIGAGAADALDRIIYNSATGALYYDADGSGSGEAIQFATLSKGLAMTNADFLIV